MLIDNNFQKMSYSDIINQPLSKATNIRIRFNCEFLHNCSFHCSGCYVYRNNNFDEQQLDTLYNSIVQFKQNGVTFDEIVLGPTDFFAAYNSIELISNNKFNKIFEDGDIVLTILSTLQSDNETIIKHIEAINKHITHPNMEIEVLIIFQIEKLLNNDIDYINSLKEKIQLLNKFNARIDYAMQMNIQDVNKIKGEFTLTNITNLVKNEFNTIVEFNPSILRTKNNDLIYHIMSTWNEMLNEQITQENKHLVTFTMGNVFHAGFNEITYNYHDGKFYICPFIYENVFDKSEPFLIKKENDEYTYNDFEIFENYSNVEMFEYANKTDECGTCPFLMSCISKSVLYYMKQYNIKSCMLAKDIMNLYA